MPEKNPKLNRAAPPKQSADSIPTVLPADTDVDVELVVELTAFPSVVPVETKPVDNPEAIIEAVLLDPQPVKQTGPAWMHGADSPSPVAPPKPSNPLPNWVSEMLDTQAAFPLTPPQTDATPAWLQDIKKTEEIASLRNPPKTPDAQKEGTAGCSDSPASAGSGS